MTSPPDFLAAPLALRTHAGQVLAAQERLRAALGGDLVGDLALELLLFLLAQDEGEGVPTSQCCAAVPVPRTTALRWIGRLSAAGMIVQHADTSDGRVTLLRLGTGARTALARWLQAIAASLPDAAEHAPVPGRRPRSGLDADPPRD